MPGFELARTCRAPAAELWALLYDPTRFTEWWTGTERMDAGAERIERYTTARPGVPMPLDLRPASDGSRVTISCLVFDIEFAWTLEPVDEGCRVRVRVEASDEDAGQLPEQRRDIATSLERLVGLAEDAARR